MFQSTHSRGVRLALLGSQTQAPVFQSTHSRGVRPINGHSYFANETVSIHALTRSATGQSSEVSATALFQSTHSRGVRRCGLPANSFRKHVSIHALTRSATAYIFSFLFSDI